MDILKSDDKFRYQMLSRLQSDCEYYLGYGNRSSNNLWAKDESEQIETMKALHNSFDKNEKPEWLTWEQILNYENQMLKVDTFETLQKHIESIGHYKDVIFKAEDKGDCVYFNAINPNGVSVSIRADVEDEVSYDKWNFYECSDEHTDWELVSLLYQ